MAATDKPLRDQTKLDLVFAISSIAMLISAILMFAQDYLREWKPEQRAFREVESRLAQRLALEQLPTEDEFKAKEAAIESAKKKRQSDEVEKEVAAIKKDLAEWEPKREKADAKLAGVKADQGSIVSLLYIDREHGNKTAAAEKEKRLAELDKEVAAAQKEVDDIKANMQPKQARLDAIDAELTKAVGDLKKLNDKFDAMATLAIKKEWGWGDTIRAWPIIDGFASPTKIHQITNNEYGINYNFKDATRFDRCTTCHLGIDRPAYTKDALRSLTRVTPEQDELLYEARERLKKRKEVLAGLPEAAQVLDPDKLALSKMSPSQLTDSRIAEYAAHPRLDLYVGANSKHPMEKFGCTTCHNGQGSATSFHWASHSPNDPEARKKWKEHLGWSHIHAGDWEFPMNPKRFTESTCIKCHYQVTDLISSDNKVEAPKVVRGYNLIRENGCFGCHEIAGRKGGRDVGPDMRLESTPPLVDLPPIERAKIEADLDNRPGNLRKVGPSLYRLADKTNPEFTLKWLRAPREFRPDTKMPHFYGTSNNDPSVLPQAQKKFPDAEMHAITHYLFTASNAYLADVAKAKTDADDAAKKDVDTVVQLVAVGKLTPKQKDELEGAQRRIRLRKARTLEDLSGGYQGDVKKGRSAFIERGCLSCHVHQATEKKEGDSPAVTSEALFGPNLSQVSAKLGKAKGDEKSAKVWLVQWLLDPMVHSPRTRMPITHLSPEEATDIATWLLAQKATDFGPDWDKLEVPAPAEKDLVDLAKVYFTRILSQKQMDDFLGNADGSIKASKTLPAPILADLPVDEREFASHYKEQGIEALKHYVGKRGVGRLGCYACHDVPGFDSARPIGTGLNDWGKKDASKIAFEDIANYFKKRYYVIDKWIGEDGKVAGPKVVDGVEKLPYEEFFAHGLLAHGGNREGYLFQKLGDPRSFDYNRIRAWDELARMPQFKFSRLRKKPGESNDDFEKRVKTDGLKDEAEAREAVASFVLGLVAEPVPMSMVNQPKGDRLAEIKGRQTLDAFNCAGCHLIRGGTFEVKASNRVFDDLGNIAKTKRPADHDFLNHFFWTGHMPGPAEGIKFHGVIPQPLIPADEEEENPRIGVRLTQALRANLNVRKDAKGDDRAWVQVDVPSSTTLPLTPSEFTFPPPTVPPPGTRDSIDKLKKFLADRQYGGTFGNLLVGYLTEKDPRTFPKDQGTGDSSKARPLVPPSLIGQGERTQPEWLYEFLLNPFPVRKMSVLRMPKFNLSPDDARSLVDYFNGVERMNNPGIGLTYPYEQIAQQDAAAADYFKAKSAEYVARLKATKSPDGKEKTMFDLRVEQLTPIWQATFKDLEAQKDKTKARLDAATQTFKDAEAKEKDAKKALDAKKDDKDAETKYKAAKLSLDSATSMKEAWERESDYLSKKLEAGSVDKQKVEWQEKDAYLTDAFKLLANKDLCMKCHQIGAFEVKNDVQGPPLTLAHGRLRPGWTERYVAHPDRFLPYPSSMPVNFPKDQPKMFEEFFVGTPLQRVQATRDVLMTLPKTSQIPANRSWILPLPDKTGEKK